MPFPLEWVIIGLLILLILLQLVSRSTEMESRLKRIDRKVDAMIKHLCIDLPDTMPNISDEVKKLAEDPSRKIEAIKRLREETGMGLAEAKEAVEEYQRSLGA